MNNSTRSRVPKVPPSFPLWHHRGSGQWCKKLRGRWYYFGKVADDPNGDEALRRWFDVRDDLLAGRTPKPTLGADTVSVARLCNHFLTHKAALLESGELAPRTFDAYHKTCEFLVDSFGKSQPVEHLGPRDFQALRKKMAKVWGPVRLRNEMGVVQSIFRFGHEAELLNKQIRFGPAWVKPSAKTLRKNREAKGPRMFTREELLKTLEHASTNLRAMILLGVQAGLGNTDLGLLPIACVDLNSQWLVYPRAKTGIQRRIPLWPETAAAIRQVLAERRKPKDPGDSTLLFIGKRGESYVGKHRGYRVTQEMKRALARAGVEGRTFYDLRRTFETVGEEAGDLVAVQSIMGHAPSAGDMSSVYRQRVSDDRLRAVTDYVRRWFTEQSDTS